MPKPSSPLVARAGFVPLLVHEAHATEAVSAWLNAPEAFDRTRGERADDQPWGAYRVAGGVALIPVLGSLIPRGLFMGSGYVTSYEMLGAELRRAATDPAVGDDVYLMIDSPGGYVSNLDATAAAIGRLRQSKRVTAYVQGMACSAAYWLASACDEIVCSPQSELGSIGVVQAHFDMSKMLEDIGLKVTLLHAGAKKVDGNPFEPLSERVKAEMQARLEQLRMAFAQAVAEGRTSLDVAAVLATEAATFTGADAVARGLADRVGYLDDDLDQDTPMLTSPLGRFMETTMNYTQAQYDQARIDGHKAGHAEGHAAGKIEGHAAGKTEGHAAGVIDGKVAGKADGEKAGAAAERERIKSIRGCDEAKKRPVAAEGLALDSEMTVEQAKVLLLRLPEEKAETTLDTEMRQDRQPLVGADGNPLEADAGKTADQKKFEEAAASTRRLLGKPAK